MAASYCLAILAGFCFSSASIEAHFRNVGLGYALTVTTPHYEASTGRTDVLRSYDWRHQPKACAGTNCVRYHKSCAAGASRQSCDYQIASSGDMTSGSIHISAASAEDIATAEREIALWFGSDQPMLPLAALKGPPATGELAPCPPDIDSKICNPVR